MSMKSSEIRTSFFNYFKSKQHIIVPSAPLVIKNDPTLMFTNAGMNQFKDIFLGNVPAKHTKVADTQKCLRVSGKHNDLEEVGHDTYHHTMFEMLGNWSFGDYFKKEAINWAWEFLVDVCKIDKNKLYVTVFEGNKEDGLAKDEEAYNTWKKIIDTDRILLCSKKDNFWEMGDVGPCGPCSEIHVDLRDEEDIKKIPGKDLVNKGNPLVIEVWNLVFIEFNRLANGKLEQLPSKHVDTGMGFERLCMVLQNKKSNYDTDVFQPIIRKIENLCIEKYGIDNKIDIAIRVIADHLRAVAFSIADGQLPSNVKAGYVIRRILRRAVRYGYTFLGFNEPFMYKLVPTLSEQLKDVFPEIKTQEDLIKKVIEEEENAFLRTLEVGIQKFNNYISAKKGNDVIDGVFAFELFDTYGFPVDLTQILAREKGYKVDMDGFNKSMEEQKKRSREATTVDSEDWIELNPSDKVEFVGYDKLEAKAKIVKYRKVKSKGKEFYQVVFDKTPFYAESGGQVGDKGIIESGNEKVKIIDTQKENNLVIHIVESLPKKMDEQFTLKVDKQTRESSANNHSATHLLHSALRQVLGKHVEQKGSMVDGERLRFDFTHYQKLTQEEIDNIEKIVNKKIRENIPLSEHREIPIDEAKKMGAVALFGEKYGDKVRVIAFDKQFSIELCGGTHVDSTGQIGLFKIISESAIAAGIRRIEAITADKAEAYISKELAALNDIKLLLKTSKDVFKNVEKLVNRNAELEKQIELLQKDKTGNIKNELKTKVTNINNINYIGEIISNIDNSEVKNLAFELKKEIDNLFLIVGVENNGKASFSIMISDNLVKEKGLSAVDLVKQLSKEIEGGGGGQPFFATAGGTKPSGLKNVIEKAKQIVNSI